MSDAYFKQQKKPDPVLEWWKGLSRETRESGIITIVLVAIAGALGWFVLKPSMAAHAGLASESAELGSKLEEIYRDSMRTQELEDETNALASNLVARTEAIVLEPLVNSLSEAAAAKLRPLASEHGVAFTTAAMERPSVPISEGGALPPKEARFFVRMPIAFRANAGYWDLVDFFADVAEKHPSATLVALSIAPRVETPDKHDVSFVLEWPAVGERPAANRRAAQ